MSEPRLQNGGSTYRLTWESPEFISMDFERLQVDRREFSALVRVTSTAPGASGLLHERRLNLDSDMAVERLAVKLTKRTPGTGLSWDRLLEMACIKIQEAYRVGKKPVLLRDIAPPADGGWLRKPLALTRLPTILFGDGSNLKSYLLLALAADICSDSELLGLEGSSHLRVGYLDAEFDGWEHKKRLRRLVGEDMPDIVYIESQGSLRAQQERLQRIIRDEELGFLVGDSVTFLCDGPPEDAESARSFFDASRQLGIGQIYAAHINRSYDTDRPFGSVFWHNGARATWFVKKQQDVGGDQVTIGLFNKKSNVDRLMPPIGFRFTWEQDRTFIERIDVRDVPELAKGIPLKDRVVRALSKGALSFKDLAELLEADAESVGRVCRRYEGKLFTLMPGADGKKTVGLASRSTPDTVRPDNPDSVRGLKRQGRTDTPPSLEGVSGSAVRPSGGDQTKWWDR